MKKIIIAISVIGMLVFTGCDSSTQPTKVIQEEAVSCVDTLIDQNLTLDELYIMQDELQTRIEIASEFNDVNIPRYIHELQCTTEVIRLME